MLTELPPLLRDEPGLTARSASRSARIAVPEVARPISIAALAQLSSRAPLVVACPTGADGRPALRRPHAVPAGRRRSSTSRRGRRCRSSASARASRRWDSGSRCCGGSAIRSAPPAIVVAGVRALLQKLGPGRDDGRADRRPAERDRRSRRAVRDSSSSSATGARSWSSTAASSPGGARSSTSSRRPPTPRSASTCGATRSTG